MVNGVLSFEDKSAVLPSAFDGGAPAADLSGREHEILLRAVHSSFQ
jgi:hypothetical protein